MMLWGREPSDHLPFNIKQSMSTGPQLMLVINDDHSNKDVPHHKSVSMFNGEYVKQVNMIKIGI